MYWFKKIARAILNLLPLFIFCFSLFGSSSVNALKHDYTGIPYFSLTVPCPVLDLESGEYTLDWSFLGQCRTYDGTTFAIDFNGDSYNSMYDNLSMSVNLSTVSSYYETSGDSPFYDYRDIYSIFSSGSDSDQDSDLFIFINPYTQSYLNSDDYSSLGSPSSEVTHDLLKYTFLPYGSNGIPPFEFSNLDGTMACDSFTNGANCSGLWFVSNYLRHQVLPYSYTTKGFYRHGSAIDTDSGYHYSYSFDIADLFNIDYIPSFSRLRIPLHEYEGYFHDSSELYQGRHFEFRGAFNFKGSFDWSENVSENLNNSYFRLRYFGYTTSSSSGVDGYVDCHVSLTQGTTPDQTYRTLEFSCPVDLDSDYLVFSPYLEISGDGDSVWFTDSNWNFASMALISDYDESSGRSFNTDLDGVNSANTIGSEEWIQQHIVNGGSSAEQDFLSSLVNLFNFTFINPFRPIYDMFTPSESCASIPTLAAWIHSQETQVCHWFSSEIRTVTTPVFTLSSMMLLFGFAVRWLKSSSGNLFEDSANEDIANVGGSGFRRYKK